VLIPKINFEFSWIYNNNWKQWIKCYNIRSDYWPSDDGIKKFIVKANNYWKRFNKQILEEASRISKLNWKEKTMKCYIVGNCIPFSNPLTMFTTSDLDNFVDVLTHELLHELLWDKNKSETRKAWDYIFKKYSKYNEHVLAHIPLYAVHEHLYLKFGWKNRLEKDQKPMPDWPNHAKAWEIVEEEGHQNIIDEFIKRIN